MKRGGEPLNLFGDLTGKRKYDFDDEEDVPIIAPPSNPILPTHVAVGPMMPAKKIARLNPSSSAGGLLAMLPKPKVVAEPEKQRRTLAPISAPSVAPKRRPIHMMQFPTVSSSEPKPVLFGDDANEGDAAQQDAGEPPAPSFSNDPNDDLEDSNAPYSSARLTTVDDLQVPTAFKRRRNQAPIEVIDVVQPQLRMTSIQPTPESMSNKPELDAPVYVPSKGTIETNLGVSRTHRRRHQLNWLATHYVENKHALEERTSSGVVTKKQAWGKYGW
eukprot:c25892_g1_i1.p1 GENE.c25892_g1_i1~~c25892_g1_i1.p1  ORF type:complete len:273 (-),score=39.58 c25892_g1_i1:78-896(-)